MTIKNSIPHSYIINSIKDKMNSITQNRAIEIIQNAKNKKIAVVGDVMLDRYFWGSVTRISPEAPVPIVSTTKTENRLGGAANVVKNINALGLEPILCSVIGSDASGEILKEINKRLKFILDVGLDYLSLNRSSVTLQLGEW